MMATSFAHLETELLAWRCQQEAELYLAGQPCDETYCLALFRRAICHNDQLAWQAIYTQYQSLVIQWVWQHSRFYGTGEEAAFFVNAAFARFWRGLSRRTLPAQFESLGCLLSYLKSCVHSAIEDACRRHYRYDHLTWDVLPEHLVDGDPTPEEQSLNSAGQILEQVIMSRLKDREEKVVATMSWLFGLRPREIQARYPDLFPSVTRIYQVKHNIMDRLLRDPEIQKLRREMS